VPIALIWHWEDFEKEEGKQTLWFLVKCGGMKVLLTMKLKVLHYNFC
jgi:hypothetical protein